MIDYKAYIEDFNKTDIAKRLWTLAGRAMRCNDKLVPVVVKQYNREFMKYRGGL